MTLESGPKNLEGGKIEAPRVPQEMPGAEAHDGVARDDLQEVESDKEKGGAVKKKIEIPGFGEIEYTEKRIMFPEKIVQETGGVKGYVRKMVSWEKLARFYGTDNRARLESKKSYKEAGGILPIISAVTNNEFIKSTFNHVLGGHNRCFFDESSLRKEKIFAKFGDLKNMGLDYFRNSKFFPVETKSNRIFSIAELFKKVDLLDDLAEKYHRGILSEDKKEKIINAISKAENVYFLSCYGLSLTLYGKLWRGFNNEQIPHLDDSIIGFKTEDMNSIIQKYCFKTLSVIQKIEKGTRFIYFGKDFENSEETLKVFTEGIAPNRILGDAVAGHHPKIPIILNHPDIPELRWCHADYAAIPTKNGYNILEMIT